MTKGRIAALVFVVAVSTVLGAVAGGYAVFKFGTEFVVSADILAQRSQAAVMLGTLEKLRNGDEAGAIERCELQLDSALISLAAFTSANPKLRNDSALLRVLAGVRDYREAHPRRTLDPDVDNMVARVLAIAQAKMSQ